MNMHSLNILSSGRWAAFPPIFPHFFPIFPGFWTASSQSHTVFYLAGCPSPVVCSSVNCCMYAQVFQQLPSVAKFVANFLSFQGVTPLHAVTVRYWFCLACISFNLHSVKMVIPVCASLHASTLFSNLVTTWLPIFCLWQLDGKSTMIFVSQLLH